MKIKTLCLIVSILFFAINQGSAEEVAQNTSKSDMGAELEQLKIRVDGIEKRIKEDEAVDPLGDRLHTVHSLRGLKIGGGLTMIFQLAACGGSCQHESFSASADVTLESKVGKDGKVAVVMDFQRGAGLEDMPAMFFTSPNGNPTGPNNDIESFNNDQLHIAQVYYEHNFDSKLIVSIGQITPVAYFDINEYANNERTQFFANLFANNPTIEFGGTKDFYGPGIRTTYGPFEAMKITLGVFDGIGEYDEMCQRYFLMAEADFKMHPFGREGNYRVYYWDKQGRAIGSEANTANPDDPDLLSATSAGSGFSIDQHLSDSFGIWLRGGNQTEKIAQFDRHFSGGVNISGNLIGRPKDSVGLGYGVTFIGSDYANYRKSKSPDFKSAAENYLEFYYNISIADATTYSGLHISPDFQYVVNAGGDKDAPALAIYGLRIQTFF